MSIAQQASDSLNAYGTPLGYNNGNSGAIAITDFSKAYIQSWILNANCVLAQPINPPPPFSRILFKFVQDATGSRVLTFAAGVFRDAPALGSSGPAGSYAVLGFIYDGASYQFEGGSTAWVGSGQQIIPGAGAAQYAGTQPLTPRAAIVPTVAALALTGAAPGVGQNQTILIPGPGGLLVNGQYPSWSRP